MSKCDGKRAPSAAANARTVLGQIRKMLREEAVLEREDLRARLRAMRKISECGFGGRRVYLLIHYLRRRGEIVTTPTHIMAAAQLVPAPRRRRGKSAPVDGPRCRRRRLAAKRARAVERRQTGGRNRAAA